MPGGVASGVSAGVFFGTGGFAGCATAATAAESDANVAVAACGGLVPILPGSGGRTGSSFDNGAGGCRGGRAAGSAGDGAAALIFGTAVTFLRVEAEEDAGALAGLVAIFAAGGRFAGADVAPAGFVDAVGDGFGAGAVEAK